MTTVSSVLVALGSEPVSLLIHRWNWKGAVAALAVLMTTSHAVEFAIHWLRGTPNLAPSITASACLALN